MLDQLIDKLKQDKTNWDKIRNLFQDGEIAAKTTLLKEGEIAQYIYFIKNDYEKKTRKNPIRK